MNPEITKRHSVKSGARRFHRGHWPPKHNCTMVSAIGADSQVPAGLYLFRSARGGASRRFPRFRAGRNRFRSLYITGTLQICNRRAVFIAFHFQALAPKGTDAAHIFWNASRRLSSKICSQRWHTGQKWVLRPPTITRLMGVPHRRHGFPVRWYTQCSSWKKPRTPSAST